MNLLALDSATANPSIALVAGGRTRLVRLEGARGRDERLVPEIAALLDAAGIGLDALGRLGVTVGPGRFTGLRAGLAAMRGLALATGLELVGVTTLAAVAEAARGRLAAGETLLATIDSRRAEAFAQLFAPDGRARGEPFTGDPDALARAAPAGPLALAGERVPEIEAAFARAGRATRSLGTSCDAAAVAALAGRAPAPAASPSPFYLHPPATTAPAAARP